MVIVVMGVAGAGKTTVGAMLAGALDCAYLDADTLHSPANVAAMARGEPLGDAERAPWLAAVHARIREAYEQGPSLVVGCSTLRRAYRETLAEGVPVVWVYLRGAPELIRERLRRRVGHFADVRLLESQVAALEEPDDAIVMDVALAPHALHGALAMLERDAVPWSHVHVFWSDERYVSADDPRSNYGMARETLLDHVPCPPSNIHPMPTSCAEPAAAARAYEARLRACFRGARPSFDVVILGLGADGHTASLFPRSPALRERERWVLAVRAAAEPPLRLTLTLPVLLHPRATGSSYRARTRLPPCATCLPRPPIRTRCRPLR